MSARRGFTLVELIIGLVLFGLVGGVIYGTLLREQRVAWLRADRIGVQSALRTGVIFLPSELRQLGTTDDLIATGPDSVTYRSLRGSGSACRISPTQILASQADFIGYRQPQPGRDSLLLFVEGDPVLASDDRWLVLPLLALGTGTCSGAPALSLSTAIDTIATPLSRFVLEAPLRTFEVMQVRLYSSGGQQWLGARSVSAGESIQPVLGPLTSAGFILSFLDSAGASTPSPALVRSVGLSLRAEAPRTVTGAVGTPMPVRDSTDAVITLRNLPSR